MNQRVIIIVIVIIVVLGGGAGGWYWGMYLPEQEAKEQARLAQIAAQEAEKQRIAEEARKREQYDQLMLDAEATFAEEDWETARSLYTQASGLFPNEQLPKDQLALVNAKLDEIAELEARRAAGIIDVVSERTGRWYVIVSSSIDDDLAMDYARRLAQEGNNVKVVEHIAEERSFFGVSLGDFETKDQAQAATSSFSGLGQTWVLKY